MKICTKLCVLIGLCTICGCIPTLDEVILRPYEREVTTTWNYTEYELPINSDIVEVWHFDLENPVGMLVLIPGSDASKSVYTLAADYFLPLNIELLLMDYRGFGGSTGDLSLDNLVEDVDLVLDFADTFNTPFVAYSISLGTPLLAYNAQTDRPNLKACIFEGTFILDKEVKLWLEYTCPNPLNAFLANMSGFYVLPQIPEVGYNILSDIQNVQYKKLFVQSTEDEVTPYAGALLVYDNAVEPKELWTIWGSHGEAIKSGDPNYVDPLTDWIIEQLNNNW